MQQILLAVLILSWLTACTSPSVSSESTNAEPEEAAQHVADSLAPNYMIQPGDQLEITYYFYQNNVSVYRLQPGDKVNIRYFNFPNLDQIQKIRPDGFLTLPYIGEVSAANKTIDELRQWLVELYRESPIVRPEISISLVDYDTQLEELKTSLTTRNEGRSRRLQVRTDGVVTFPILGDVSLTYKTMPQARALLNQKYAEVHPNLSVDLMLHSSETNRIFVLGAVNAPGAYTLNRPTHLLEIIAMSGGIRTGANLENVLAFKTEGEALSVHKYNLKRAFKNADKGKLNQVDLAILYPGQIIYVPKSGLFKTSEIMQQLQNALMFRGIGVTINSNAYSEND